MSTPVKSKFNKIKTSSDEFQWSVDGNLVFAKGIHNWVTVTPKIDLMMTKLENDCCYYNCYCFKLVHKRKILYVTISDNEVDASYIPCSTWFLSAFIFFQGYYFLNSIPRLTFHPIQTKPRKILHLSYRLNLDWKGKTTRKNSKLTKLCTALVLNTLWSRRTYSTSLRYFCQKKKKWLLQFLLLLLLLWLCKIW